MSRRTERLDRLVVQSPCPVPRQARGGAAGFCSHCNRHVHDLAALDARQIEALIAVTGGRFCGRITRDAAGRLVTRKPRIPLSLPPAAPPRRASPAAAAVVTALVGLSGAAQADGGAQAARPQPPLQAPAETGTAAPAPARQEEPGAVLAGRAEIDAAPLPGVAIVARSAADGRERTAQTGADGTFTLAGVPAGDYEIEALLEGLVFPRQTVRLEPGRRSQGTLRAEAQMIEGIIAVPTAEPLRRVVDASSLVAIAVVEASVPQDDPAEGGESETREVLTELHLSTVLKGSHHGRTVTVLREEMHGEEGLRPGDTVLALLEPEDDEDPQSVYLETDPRLGLGRLPEESLRSYRRQIEALVELEREPAPEELAEWLVATSEDEQTRGEAVGELKGAAAAYAELADEAGTAEEQAGRLAAGDGEDEIAPAVLGAALTAGHRERLVRALLATESLTGPDVDLFELVRPWAGEEAERWLRRVFREREPEPSWQFRRVELHLLGELDDPGLEQLLAQADEQLQALLERFSDEPWTPAVNERLDAEVLAIEKEVRAQFLRALDGRRN